MNIPAQPTLLIIGVRCSGTIMWSST